MKGVLLIILSIVAMNCIGQVDTNKTLQRVDASKVKFIPTQTIRVSLKNDTTKLKPSDSGVIGRAKDQNLYIWNGYYWIPLTQNKK